MVEEVPNPMRINALRRAASIAALAISMAVVTIMLAPSPAEASTSSERTDFVMRVFPHDTTAVNFWDSWGAPRSGGRRHQGTDIMSPRGTEVVAVADGTVVDFGEHRMSGYFIRLDHGDGWATSYMHLNNDTIGTDDGEGGIWAAIHPTIAIGATVAAGDVIGYVGDSGNAEGTRPHTHFEVKVDGKKINPYPFLRDVWDRQLRGPQTQFMPR